MAETTISIFKGMDVSVRVNVNPDLVLAECESIEFQVKGKFTPELVKTYGTEDDSLTVEEGYFTIEVAKDDFEDSGDYDYQVKFVNEGKTLLSHIYLFNVKEPLS